MGCVGLDGGGHPTISNTPLAGLLPCREVLGPFPWARESGVEEATWGGGASDTVRAQAGRPAVGLGYFLMLPAGSRKLPPTPQPLLTPSWMGSSEVAGVRFCGCNVWGKWLWLKLSEPQCPHQQSGVTTEPAFQVAKRMKRGNVLTNV